MNYIKAIIKNAYTKLSYAHSNTYAWLSNTLRATATMLRWHPAALKSMLMTPQPQNLGERRNRYCHARQGCQRWDQSWDVGTAGCPLPIATLQPNTWLCPVTRSTRAWKHPFSFFSFFYFFKCKAPSHKTRHSRLQKVSVRTSWTALNRLHSSARPLSRAAPSLAADLAKHRARARYKSLPLKGNI